MPRMYFWRTSTGTEVDIAVESCQRLVPIEVKLSSTPRSAMASGIRTFQEDFGDKALRDIYSTPVISVFRSVPELPPCRSRTCEIACLDIRAMEPLSGNNQTLPVILP